MNIGLFFREFWNDVKAWRRGQVRIAPYGSTGRVYVDKEIWELSKKNVAVATNAVGVIRMTVTRADGTVEELPPVLAYPGDK